MQSLKLLIRRRQMPGKGTSGFNRSISIHCIVLSLNAFEDIKIGLLSSWHIQSTITLI